MLRQLLLASMLLVPATLLLVPTASAGCTPTPSACVLWCPPPPSQMTCRILPYGLPIGPVLTWDPPVGACTENHAPCAWDELACAYAKARPDERACVPDISL